MKWLKKLSKNSSPEFLEARDMNTMAYHVQDSDGAILCGSSNAMYGKSPVTAQKVIDSVHTQHDGWYWCSRCAAELTGETPDFFVEARRNSGK